MPEAETTLFTSRCSDVKMREMMASSAAPPYARSTQGQGGASHQQAGSAVPQALPGRIKVVHSERNHPRKRAWSTSQQGHNDLCPMNITKSSVTARKRKTTSPLGPDHAPSSATAPGPSKRIRICHQVPVLSLAWVPTWPVQSALGRPSWQGYGLWSHTVEITHFYQPVWWF